MLRKLILEKLHTQRDVDFIKLDNKFIKEIEEYFKKAEIDKRNILTLRENETLEPNASLIYFRTKERIEIRKKVVQILLAIALDKIPDKTDSLVFKQLYQTSKDLISFFNEDDVYEESMKEIIGSEFLTSFIDDVKFYYDFNLKEIKEKLTIGKDKKEFVSILEALFLSSLFWFVIREGDINRIRKSDLYIYLLSKKLIEEYKYLKN